MSNTDNRRLEIIKKIVDYGLNHDKFTLTELSAELKFANKYIKEYIDLIEFISNNPILVSTYKMKKYTYYEFKKPQE